MAKELLKAEGHGVTISRADELVDADYKSISAQLSKWKNAGLVTKSDEHGSPYVATDRLKDQYGYLIESEDGGNMPGPPAASTPPDR